MKNKLTAKRLKVALEALNMKPQELSDKSGVGKASISQYINGSHSPSNISSGKMGKILNVNPLWLMGFDVPMERANSIPPSVSKKAEQPPIMNYYNALNKIGKQEAEKRVEELTQISKYTIKSVNEESDHLTPIAAHNDAAQTGEQLSLMLEDAEDIKNL